MTKVAIINQRYGLEINGGSEYYTRLIAERINDKFDITVLTSCAVEASTWRNEYKEGDCVVNGVKVKRFKADGERAENLDQILDEAIILYKDKDAEQLKFIEAQGPKCDGLFEYIKNNKDNYDVFIFVTYLFYTTIRCYEAVKEKAILIPTAHDERYIYLSRYIKMLREVSYIIYLTEEEKIFAKRLAKNSYIPSSVMGVGVDVPDKVNDNYIKEKYGIDNYIAYVGRIEEGKGVHELIEFFIQYKRRYDNGLKLVLVGKKIMPIPKHKDVIYVGFVSEQEKFNIISGAKMLMLSSQFESLSIAVLESLAVSTPVVVNGLCEVLKAHAVRSMAGLYYENYDDFEGVLNFMLNNSRIYNKMKANAKRYIENNYIWDNIISNFYDIIEKVASQNEKNYEEKYYGL